MLIEIAVIGGLAAYGYYATRREKTLQAQLAELDAEAHHTVHRVATGELEELVYGLWREDESWLGPPWKRLRSDDAFCAAAHLHQMDAVAAHRLLLNTVERHVTPAGYSGARFLKWQAESLTPVAVGTRRYKGLTRSDLRERIEAHYQNRRQ